jgi:hypothetical protein
VISLQSKIATAPSPSGDAITSIPTRPQGAPQSSPAIVRQRLIENRRNAMTMTVRIGTLSFAGLFAIVACVAVMLLAFGDEAGKQLNDLSKAVLMPLQEGLANARRLARPAHLVIESQKGGANGPLPLGVSLSDAAGGETVMVAGLADGTELSLGTSLGSAAWLVSASDLDKTFVGAPKDFVGIMEVTVSLRSAGERLLDRQVIRLEWTRTDQDRLTPPPDPPKLDPPRLELSKLDSPKVDPTPKLDSPKVDSPSKLDSPKFGPGKVEPSQQAQAVQSLNPDEIATLIKVAKDFLQRGDIASARVSLRRAAIAGNAQAALELGKTFDQAFLAKWGVLGFAADPAQAREWYDRAVELGSAEASQHLARLASVPR